MKKFLALVLALVMTMSLVTISSSAKFSDADEIVYDEAVSILTAIGVIDGMGDGTYAPKGSVTRAQMAKMITFISLGVAEASAFEGTKTDLTDVDGHWAEAYIKYCYSQGIIAGKGNGKFDPDANVTTAEAAKMLLVALGWNADVQGYVGEQWQVNTIRDAFKSKVFEGINLAAEKTLNRDEAAKLIYNTILTSSVVVTSSVGRGDGSIRDDYSQNGPSLLSKTFDATRYEGLMTGISYNSKTKEYTYSAGQAFGAGQNDRSQFVALEVSSYVNGIAQYDVIPSFTTADDYTNFLNEEIVVVEKDVDGRKSVLGVYATGDTVAEISIIRDLSVSSGKLVVNGTKYTVEDGCEIRGINNTTGVEDITLDGTNTLLEVAGMGIAARGVYYDFVKVVDTNEDGKLDTYGVFGHVAGKVTYASKDEIIVDYSETFKYADDVIADGIAKGDYVYYSQNWNGQWVVTEIEPFEAVASATNHAESRTRFNDSWYNDVVNTNLVAGSTYRVWAYNNVVVGVELISGLDVKDLVLAYAASDAWDNEVKYIGVDGVKKTVSIDGKGDAYVIDGDTLRAQLSNNDGLYTVSVTDDGTEFALPRNIGNSYNYNNAGTLQDGTDDGSEIDMISGHKIASDAVVLVSANNGVAVITGSQLMKHVPNDFTSVLGYYTNNYAFDKLERVTHVGVIFSGDVEDLNSSTGKETYAYVTDGSVKTVGSDGVTQYRQFSIWNGTEHLTVSYKSSTAVFNEGDVLKYDSIDENGVITGITVFDGQNNRASAITAAVHAVGSKAVYINGDNAYDLTSDTKYLYIDSDASDAAAIGVTGDYGLSVAEFPVENDKTTYINNIIYVANSDDEIVVVVVDVKNNMKRGDYDKVDMTQNGVYGMPAGVSVSATTVRQGAEVKITFANAGTYTLVGALRGDGASSVTVSAKEVVKVYVTDPATFDVN